MSKKFGKRARERSQANETDIRAKCTELLSLTVDDLRSEHASRSALGKNVARPSRIRFENLLRNSILIDSSADSKFPLTHSEMKRLSLQHLPLSKRHALYRYC